jgi:2-keto-3-deoxy-6-phosphogluconate aldolase
MFLVVAVIRVDDVEELADLVLQLVGLGFGIVETVVCDRIRRGFTTSSNATPTSE